MTKMLSALLLSAAALCGCIHPPRGVPTVDHFVVDRYLGRWYEIARLDHSFERGLTRVGAEYSRRDDGGIKVVNRGFDARRSQWKEAVGRAYFVGEPTVGLLKVSFFGPFYGGYNIVALDRESYNWALVCGPSRDYLWILSRTPKLEPEVLARLTLDVEPLTNLTTDRGAQFGQRIMKLATLLYCFNEQDDVLLLERAQPPNEGLWSPCGGKLHTDEGESPYACACREGAEEAGLSLAPADLHLTGLVSEHGYQGQAPVVEAAEQ